MVQGAIVTRGLLRMRCHFPDLLLVMKQSLPFSFRKPDGRVHGGAILAEGRKTDITLALNLARN